MTIFKKSVKLVMSREEILNYKPRRGIDVTFTPVKYGSDVYVATFSGTDLNPSNEAEECEKSDLDIEIGKLKVYSDVVRNPTDFQKIPGIARVQEMRLDDPKLNPNKYDHLRGKAKNVREDGFATLQEG